MDDLYTTVARLRAGAAARRESALSAVRDYFRPMLRSDGSWDLELAQSHGRLDLQLCVAFYRGDAADIALANAMTRRAPMPQVEGKRFGIFNTSIACQHLADSRAVLEAETIAWCEAVLDEGCTEEIGMPAPDFQFYGYNDNMPAMAAKTLVLAGEWLNRPDLYENGLWKLRALAEQLSTFGLIGEYNSPNYTVDTIHNLMTLYRHTADAEVRALIEPCVRRIWLDLAAHWHPRGRCPAGPFSRAYEHDFSNYLSSQACALWVIMGQEVSGISALETMKPRPGMHCMHGDNPLEHSTRMAWYATTDDALLDDETAALFVHKPSPYHVIATALQGDAGRHAPYKKTVATSHITHDFSLGTAAFPFCRGEQTASLYVTGAGGEISPVLGTKYLIDDETPGRMHTDHWHITTTGTGEFHNHGTAVTVQDQASALVSYVPHRHYADSPVKDLRLAVIAPTAVGQFGGFFDADGQPLPADQPLPTGQWYGARLGAAIVAIRPLAYSALELPPPTLVLRQNPYYSYLEIVNYQGPARCFSDVELSLILNGAAVEVASAADWPSPGDFLQALASGCQVDDHFFIRARHLRYHRAALADRPATTLGLRYSTETDGSAIRTINGRLAPEPTWDCTGLPAHALPLLGETPYIAAPGLPWGSLRVARFPADSRTAINHA